MKMELINKIKDYWWRNDTFMEGHISIGNITIYGRNAMHWGVNIYTKKYGYVCFRLPLPCFGRWWPLYFYCSPNATSWAATFIIGKKHDRDDWALSRIRRLCLGHNFEVHGWNDEYECENYEILRGINRSVSTWAGTYYKWQKDHSEKS